MDENLIQQKLENIEKLLKPQAYLGKLALSVDEVAAYTGFSKLYIYKLTSRNAIPFYRPNGKNIFFNREEIDDWLLRNRASTNEEIGNEAATKRLLGKGLRGDR